MPNGRPSKESVCDKLVKAIEYERDVIISHKDLIQDINIVEGSAGISTIEHIRRITKEQQDHIETLSKIYTDMRCPMIRFREKERERATIKGK